MGRTLWLVVAAAVLLTSLKEAEAEPEANPNAVAAELGKEVAAGEQAVPAGDAAAAVKASAVAAGKDPECGSCYGAESETIKCCNTCQSIKDAYDALGWAFRMDHEAMFQCVGWELTLSGLKKEADLTEKENERMKIMHEREEFMHKHAGHESMHAEMMLVLMGTMIAGQVVLVVWRTNHFKSYQTVTLVGMYLIPVYFSVELHFNKTLEVWALFSLCTGYVIFKATRKPLEKNTPRRVYTYFTVLYKLTYFATFAGYGASLLDFLGFGTLVVVLFGGNAVDHPLMTIGLVTMFYGLYFGVLVRDFAEIAAGSMASYIGYYNTEGKMASVQLADDVCAICGEQHKQMEGDPEKISKLSCGHSFHEYCIRGWCIIGKKQSCPYCGEKVDLKILYPQPWSLERQDVLFSQLLDAIRYLVVWQPAIIGLVKLINHGLGLE